MSTWRNLTEHPHIPTPERELTRTQRDALAYLRAHPDRGQWPLARPGRFTSGWHDSDHRWSQPTLQALVAAGHVAWRGSTFDTPTRHGVMPHVVLLDRESSGSRQHWIETGLYLTHAESAAYATSN